MLQCFDVSIYGSSAYVKDRFHQENNKVYYIQNKTAILTNTDIVAIRFDQFCQLNM